MHSLHHHGPLNEGAKRQILKQLKLFVKKKTNIKMSKNKLALVSGCPFSWFVSAFLFDKHHIMYSKQNSHKKQLTFRLSVKQWLFLSILDIALKITKKCKWKQRLDNEGSCLFSRVSVSLLSSVHFYSRRKMVSVLWHNKKIISDIL